MNKQLPSLGFAGLLAAAAIIYTLAPGESLAQGMEGAAPSAARWNVQGELLQPENYPEWIFVGATTSKDFRIECLGCHIPAKAKKHNL